LLSLEVEAGFVAFDSVPESDLESDFESAFDSAFESALDSESPPGALLLEA
jgi:hypothetical protein